MLVSIWKEGFMISEIFGMEQWGGICAKKDYTLTLKLIISFCEFHLHHDLRVEWSLSSTFKWIAQRSHEHFIWIYTMTFCTGPCVFKIWTPWLSPHLNWCYYSITVYVLVILDYLSFFQILGLNDTKLELMVW